ncbi:MAG: tRNA uridine-5-carboxymethylaminomethyl(34) synthesis GTPase MnmE, partial [Firmicutes bacterium]|nr:tRNA uridine-5-carboxymethylaminomethyl(34) synthesis GTPase MnmE [Bacillota bacterium]
MSHTIAAVSTGSQVSAIGILRLSGDGCAEIAGKVFQRNNGASLSEAPDRKLVLGVLRDREGRVIDQCLAVYTRGPHSYTGEDTVEIQCHGSPAVLSAGLEALFTAGARPAGRGEFTKRAFLHGQLDLTQAEAVIDLIEAETA